MLSCKVPLLFFLLNAVLFATPLHKAVEDINEARVRTLVDKGADVNAVDEAGKTVLHLATEIGRLSLVQYLVEHGADLYIKDKAHKTPLVYAIEKNHIKVIVYLSKLINEKRPIQENSVFTAVKEGDIEGLKAYLKTVDVNVTDEDGKTLLHLACEYQQDTMVKLLLSLGIDTKSRDHDGRDALNYAKLSGNKKIIRLLEDLNATQ